MPTPGLALLRLSGEVSTKAKATRRNFITQLLRNVKEALQSAGIDSKIERHHERAFVSMDDEAGIEILSRVFGLQSVARAERHIVRSAEEIVEIGERLFKEAVVGKRFAVRARSVGGTSIPGLRSKNIEIPLGTALLPESAGVDLDHPQVVAGIETYRGATYFFHEDRTAPAGLPLGCSGRGVALVSGGFDSPVAAWQLLRRGVNLDYVFCNLGGFSHQLGTVRVMQVIANQWSYGTNPRLHSVDFSAVTRELQRCAEPRYWQVILKRLMLRAATEISGRRGAHAIVTGDAVGQVSSQTLVNLRTISEATDLPILRPLVGSNKEEIIRFAERIGTAKLSSVVDEYCDLTTDRPATAAKLDVVKEQEARMDPEVLARALAEREVIDLRKLDPEACGIPEIETDEVPEGARVIDLRSRREYDNWHYPDALQLDFGRARDAYASFAKDTEYVLYCEYGLKSAHLAEMMREAGQRAYHFRGGTRALKKWATAKGLMP